MLYSLVDSGTFAAMKTNFTPGPWTIEAGLSGLFICAPTTHETSPTRAVIAETCNTEIPLDQEDANAKLIAAAPEMHDALSLINRAFNTEMGRSDPSGNVVIADCVSMDDPLSITLTVAEWTSIQTAFQNATE